MNPTVPGVNTAIVNSIMFFEAIHKNTAISSSIE